MKQCRMARSFLYSAVFLLACATLPAQDSGTTIRGTVRNRAGAAVSGASIRVKNLGTGENHTTRSDDQGQFTISGLAPGGYDLEVVRTDYVSQRRAEVEIAAGRPLSLDIVLEPQAASGGSGGATRISEAQLVGLPLNGRSYNQLATLQAGITSTSGEQSSRGVGGGSLTVAGGRSTSNNFLLDGTNIMDTFNQVPRSAAGVQLGSDAIYQVQVFSTNYGADYGRGSGGTLNSITRSGTNEFHVTLFEYFRNSKLDWPNFFDRDPLNPTVLSTPPFKRNQFGFTLTGPIRKERTFWMGSFEAMRDRQTNTDVGFFPDAAVRQGDFTDAAGNFVRHVPVNSRVAHYLALFPLPNLGSIGGGVGRNVATVFLPTSENYFIVRVDHKLTDQDSFFARYVYDDATSTDNQAVYLFRTATNSRQQYLTLVESHIFNLTTLNAFRFGYTRPVNFIQTVSSIEIPRSLFFVSGAPQFGQIEIPGLPTFGPQFTSPERNIMNSFQFADDVVAQRGSHTLKFGFDIHRYRWDVSNSHSKAGIWSFNSLESFLQAGPDGTALSVALPGSDNKKAYRQTLAGFYLQDSYQINSRLQLNLGLRYEFASIIKENTGRIALLPDIVHDTAVQTGPMLARNPSKLNFSPRFSFSWSPDSGRNTVLSGGVGIYYDPLLEYLVDLQKNSFPYYKRAVRPSFDASTFFPDAVAAATAVSYATPFQVEVLDYHHLKSQSVIRYNLSLQRTFPGGWRAQASYVGARGNHLYRGYEANLYPVPVRREDGSLFFPSNAGPINPAFGGIILTTSDTQSFYNALQVSGSKSLGQGISVQSNYTYSKSVDDSSSSGGGSTANFTRQYPFLRTLDRARSDFDIRHRLVVSYFYNLPAGRGQTWWKTGPLAAIFGGWRLGGISSLRSGTPFHALVNVRDSRFLFTATRPNLLPGRHSDVTEGISVCERFPDPKKLGGWERYFDPCSFDVPELGTLGNVGRNTIDSPSVFSMDASLQKDFLLGGEKRLQVRAEFFNVLNRTNFAGPSRTSRVIYSGAFPGRANRSAGEITGTVTTSRQIQFALRLSF